MMLTRLVVRYSTTLQWTAGLVVSAMVAGWLCGVSINELIKGIGKGIVVVTFFFPPDWSELRHMTGPAAVTLVLALVSTLSGAILAVPIGLAAAHNVAPIWIRQPARLIISLERSLPEIVVLVLMIAALGLGPGPAVFALTFGSIGMLGKLVADAAEEVPESISDSLLALGATRLQIIRYGVMPHVLPSFVSSAIFRFEVNVRSSVLLGAAGAGGIGYELWVAMNALEYNKAIVCI